MHNIEHHIIEALHAAYAHRRIIVGMSGGVDSSVAAYLLHQAGAEVHGVFMKNWEESFDPGFCSAADDLVDAQEVCDKLGIPLHKVNFAEDYRQRVFNYFIDTLKQGFTPNPDVLCNKEIKFKAFLDYAATLGADYIATGHYARTLRQNQQVQLAKAYEVQKDQSYFLHLLNQSQLQKAIFPLGEMTDKSMVRTIAEREQLITFNKKDSTGICFIGERDFTDFIGQYLPTQIGEMITPEGEVVGKHQGLAFYTIGQRQGLGIGGRKNTNGSPWFVADKKMSSNQLIVVQGEHPLLYRQHLSAHSVHFIDNRYETITTAQPIHAKIRYRQQDQAATLTLLPDHRCRLEFAQPQRAVTPGQSVVFYQQDICLGGAIIEP